MKRTVTGLLVLAAATSAGTAPAAEPRIYWVSSDGTAAWTNCEGSTPLSGASACSMAAANAKAVAGDVVNIRGGVYNTNIQPLNSGTAESRITYRGYGGETVTITDVGDVAGIELRGVDYIHITDVTVQNTYRLVMITKGSNHNEISHCSLHGGMGPANNGVNIVTVGAIESTKNTHNWIHHCVIYEAGYIEGPAMGCDDKSGLISIGAPSYDGISNHNTIEDNEIYWGAHHAVQVLTRFNVVRNNFIHNEGHFAATLECQALACAPDGVYGNRSLTMLYYHGDAMIAQSSGTYNLIENNRLGHAGLPSDGNGGDNLTLGGAKDIARYNAIFSAMELGIYFRSSGNPADHNRVYNNTIAYNGQGPQCRVDASPGFWKGGVRVQASADSNALKNNIIFGNGGKEWSDKGTGTITANNWFTGDGDPRFTDAGIPAPGSASAPDLSLRSDSGAIDRGTFLAKAIGAGSNSRTLHVDDALYFQYGERGSSLSKIHADWIAVGTVANTAQIEAIDYLTGTITLASPLTWSESAPIWLSRDSRGTQVLSGAAPDQGAYESFATAQPPKAPTGLGFW